MSGIIVALDFPTIEEARSMAELVGSDVAGFKVGLELITGVGPQAISLIAALDKPVFADVKLHDIPNTVGGAARRIAAAGARWVTVHAAGGREMMEAAVEGMGGTGVLAVSVLTSFDEGDLDSIGIESRLDDQVVRLARLGESAGAEGLVCAPGDVLAVREAGVDLTIFTPGIRVDLESTHDQKRVGTPAMAHEAGADYLVVGRPITRSGDPVMAAREINRSLGATT
ncbi:MAG TPA: orotidine-5'-phosphate decarboxylase [Acidimicrobiia bacterium]|nr:orotidine-5'-phosphate decarboxylase [Acidimicrobiia bacterium]